MRRHSRPPPIIVIHGPTVSLTATPVTRRRPDEIEARKPVEEEDEEDLIPAIIPQILPPPAAPPDLAITKGFSYEKEPVEPGDTIGITIDIENVGAGPTTGTITVTDTLPTGLSYVNHTGSGDWDVSVDGQAITATHAGPLAAETTLERLNIAVLVGESAVPEVTNTATVSTEGDTNTANDTDSATVTVVGVQIYRQLAFEGTATGTGLPRDFYLPGYLFPAESHSYISWPVTVQVRDLTNTLVTDCVGTDLTWSYHFATPSGGEPAMTITPSGSAAKATIGPVSGQPYGILTVYAEGPNWKAEVSMAIEITH